MFLIPEQELTLRWSTPDGNARIAGNHLREQYHSRKDKAE